MVLTRQQQLYTYLSGIFVAALLIGDLTGGKAFAIDVHLLGLRYRQPVSVGLFAFPITFLLTDIVNEFYGTKGARFLTLLGMWMAVFSFIVLNVSQLPAADPNSYFTDAEFNKVFGVGGKLFVASIIAYLLGPVPRHPHLRLLEGADPVEAPLAAGDRLHHRQSGGRHLRHQLPLLVRLPLGGERPAPAAWGGSPASRSASTSSSWSSPSG